MPTQLTADRHLDGLHEAVTALAAYAGRAGLGAAVPTRPGWTVLDLVAHQGMAHRWAAALVRGERPTDEDVAAHERAGREAADPLVWLVDGGEALARELATAPADRECLVFLRDAPPGPAFWARRECHETSVHALDALAAALGRPPRPEEVWLGAELAGDGIDELLGGFLTRPRSRLRCADDALLVVRPTDLGDWWEVALGPRPAVTTRHAAGGVPEPEPDWELTGTAVELHLRLWDRAEPSAAGGAWPGGRLGLLQAALRA